VVEKADKPGIVPDLQEIVQRVEAKGK
jgi:hypothetical protein